MLSSKVGILSKTSTIALLYSLFDLKQIQVEGTSGPSNLRSFISNQVRLSNILRPIEKTYVCRSFEIAKIVEKIRSIHDAWNSFTYSQMNSIKIFNFNVLRCQLTFNRSSRMLHLKINACAEISIRQCQRYGMAVSSSNSLSMLEVCKYSIEFNDSNTGRIV